MTGNELVIHKSKRFAVRHDFHARPDGHGDNFEHPKLSKKQIMLQKIQMRR